MTFDSMGSPDVLLLSEIIASVPVQFLKIQSATVSGLGEIPPLPPAEAPPAELPPAPTTLP